MSANAKTYITGYEWSSLGNCYIAVNIVALDEAGDPSLAAALCPDLFPPAIYTYPWTEERRDAAAVEWRLRYPAMNRMNHWAIEAHKAAWGEAAIFEDAPSFAIHHNDLPHGGGASFPYSEALWARTVTGSWKIAGTFPDPRQVSPGPSGYLDGMTARYATTPLGLADTRLQMEAIHMKRVSCYFTEEMARKLANEEWANLGFPAAA